MKRKSILQPDLTYTFHKYFEMNVDLDDLMAEFNVVLKRQELVLPTTTVNLEVTALKRQLRSNLQYVDLTSEAARRESLVFPILIYLCEQTQSRLKIEYAIDVNQYLRGNLDYYIQSTQNFLVVEAKQADLPRGFTQLAVEMVALDQWTDLESDRFYGAVTTGDVWKFGCFDRSKRIITQDLNLYTVPGDLSALMHHLLAALESIPMEA